MHPSLLILLVGFLYILGFNGLSYVRHQAISVRFLVEGLIITGLGAALALVVSFHPVLFLLALYLITMRVRLLTDLGSSMAARGRPDRALRLFDVALGLGPDLSSRRVAEINRAAALLQTGQPEEAYQVLRPIVTEPGVRLGPKYQAAACYNLGLACRRTGREPEAIQRFNEAIDALPGSVYAQAARKSLHRQKAAPPSEAESASEEE